MVFNPSDFFQKSATTMDETNKTYYCINCGKEVKSLFKKYSATVLKLTDCDDCRNVADKYVEYDVVIIILDLVLLQKEAYRHVLFNADLKNFWKLSVILLLMEAYSEWTLNSPHQYVKIDEDQKPDLHEVDIEGADFQFYTICLRMAIKTSCFVFILFFLTRIYCKIWPTIPAVSLLAVWKTITVSSFGIFLLLPSLIWDVSVQEFHLSVVALYTTLSQLSAYTVICNCPKIWSVVAIFSAYYCKSLGVEFVEIVRCSIKQTLYKI